MKALPKFWILLLPFLSTLLLILVFPLGAIYHMLSSTLERVTYIIGLYGLAFWIIIPSILIGVFLSLFINRDLVRKARIVKNTKYAFVSLSVLFLILNSFFAFSKYVLNVEPFPRELYSEIQATTENVDPIKNGVFKTYYGNIYRTGNNHRVEYNNGEVVNYKVVWLTNGEHLLLEQNDEKVDTLRVKVVNITPTHYKCCYNYSGFAVHDKLEILE